MSVLRESCGAMGDLGTLLPLAIALITINGMDASKVFGGVGLIYIISGCIFKLPMPVQPLKSIAAISITQRFSPDIISTAGILMGIILILIAIVPLIMSHIERYFSQPIIKGLQLTIGIILFKKGLEFIFNPEGMSFSLIQYPKYTTSVTQQLLLKPNEHDSISQIVFTALFSLVIPQLPLTIGNSLIATADTALTYFPKKANRVNSRSLALSLGLANLFNGIIGSLPVCHGSGGLTAHYSFGARTFWSNIIIGTLLIFIAISPNINLPYLLNYVPLPILGISLVYVGIKHCLLIRALLKEVRSVVLISFTAILSLISNMFIGMVGAIILESILWVKADTTRHDLSSPKDKR